MMLRWMGWLVIALVLSGCAAKNMPGYERVYQGYNVPQSLVDRIERKFKTEGLTQARIVRDPTGRLQLDGVYADDDQVEKAFLITQAIVGIKSTAPYYPAQVRERRWTKSAEVALEQFRRRSDTRVNLPGRRLALVVGISHFLDKRIGSILGEEDGRAFAELLRVHGYTVTSLLGPQATKAGIEAAVGQLGSEMRDNDTLVIYVSSHGNVPVLVPGRPADERSMSIVAYDSSMGNSSSGDDRALRIQETSVSDELLKALVALPSKGTLVLIDTCYSGEILGGLSNEESARYVRQTNGGQVERESVSLKSWQNAAYTSKGIQLVQEAATPPAQRKQGAMLKTLMSGQAERGGRTFITATSSGELAWGPPSGGTFTSPTRTGREVKGSFFTMSFIEYIGATQGNVEDAFKAASDFTRNKVANEVRKSNPTARQNPVWFTNIPRAENLIGR